MGESTSVWSQLDQMKREHDKTKEQVAAFRHWRFKGRRLNGQWWARYRSGKRALVIEADTADGLLKKLKSEFCPACGHRWCVVDPAKPRGGYHAADGCHGRVGIHATKQCPCKAAPPAKTAVSTQKELTPLPHVQESFL